MFGVSIGIMDGAGASGGGASYESIATTTVGSGGASSVTFSSIPSDYTHLQIRAIGRSSFASVGAQTAFMQFNGDTASNYVYHNLQGDGSSVTASSGTSASNLWAFIVPQLESTNSFGVGVIDILDYKNTNKFKTTRTLYGSDTNATLNFVGFRSGVWRSTSAITSITFTLTSSTNLQQYSQFALYGIKG